MDGRTRVNYVVAGDPVAAHRKGAQDSVKIWGAAQPAYADIVISESYPADYDLWQAAKGIYSAELSLRQGGVAILVTPCPHGVSDEHPEVEVLGYRGFEEVKGMVQRKEITDLVIVYSTAEWTKFSPTIANALTGEKDANDIDALQSIASTANISIPAVIQELFLKPIVQDVVIDKENIEAEILKFLE